MSKLALILSLLANGLAVYALFGRGAGGGGSAASTAAPAKVDAPVDELARRMQEELDKSLSAHDERLTREVKKLAWNLEKLLADWTAKLPELQTRSERTTNTNAGKLEELDAQVTAQGASFEKFVSSVDSLVVRVKALEARPVSVAPTGPAAASGPVKPPPPEEPKATLPNAPPEDPEVVRQKVEKALTDLDSGNPDVIYPAITVVSQYSSFEAVPKLAKLLWPEATQHEDVFTRQAAAAALGKIKSVEGVHALAEAIADRAEMVSQQANKSFRMITDYDTGLSPKARIQERRKAVSAALEWWGRHEDEVRARLKQPKGGAPPK
jgi:hypothetical protein